MERADLVEIKKGSVGNGLLIENDGYISMSEGNNKQIKESIENSDGWNCPNPFIVDAVFQKYGIKNANGRIYPENILRKQVEIYQQKINEKRALGECYTPDVMVLSKNGWVTMESLKEGDEVLTLNTENDNIEIQKVEKKIEYDFNDDMIRIKGNGINDLVTPNHGYPLYDCNTIKFNSFKTANDILKYKNSFTNLYIPFSKDDLVNGKDSTINNFYVNKEHYEGKVMCIEVKNHTFFVMSNGFTHWSKNCNHPAESTIDLGRISHNIIELHWEGRTLVGKMEINLSRGYVKYGICSTLGDTVANLLLNGYKIGVSSRGVGSVEQDRMGQYIVGDDFELICWDIVSDPSTPNAWIGHEEELHQYVENKETKKTVLGEKIDKIKNIL